MYMYSIYTWATFLWLIFYVEPLAKRGQKIYPKMPAPVFMFSHMGGLECSDSSIFLYFQRFEKNFSSNVRCCLRLDAPFHWYFQVDIDGSWWFSHVFKFEMRLQKNYPKLTAPLPGSFYAVYVTCCLVHMREHKDRGGHRPAIWDKFSNFWWFFALHFKVCFQKIVIFFSKNCEFCFSLFSSVSTKFLIFSSRAVKTRWDLA